VPDLPEIGVPIDTLNGGAGGVLLGAPLFTFFPPTGPGVQLVALDRTDLTKVASHTYPPTLSGMQSLLRAVQSLGSSDLVIVASPAGSNSSIQVVDPSAVSILNQALSIIGAPEATQGNVANPPPQGFSAIGVPGAFCCESAINPGLNLTGADGTVHQNGDLSGYLQLDNTQHYTYVSPDYVPFNTNAAGTTASQAVVTMGNHTYTSDALPAGQAGFFLMLLDAGSLQLVQKDTAAVSGGGISPFDAGNNLFTLTRDIQSAYRDPSKLLVLQSIGQVQRTDDSTGGLNAAWDDFATAQGQIGGNGLYLNALSPGAYTYVGPAQPNTGANSQFSATSSADASGGAGAGQLSGMLARNSNSQYWPRVAGPLTPATAFLPTVVYQPPTPWPLRDTPAQRQAMACIAAALQIPAPIEDDYTNSGYDFGSLSGPLDRLSSSKLPNLPQCSTGFQASDFDNAQNELATEFNYVATVGQLTSDLQKPLVAGASSVQANLVNITQNIQSSVNPPDGQTASNAEDVLNTFFYAGSNIPGAGSLISLEGSYFDLTAQLVDNGDGSNEVTQDVTSDADSLGDVLAGRLQDTYNEMDRIRELLVSDYGKLQTVFQNIGGPWALSSQADEQAQDALTASAQQLVYEALFPLQFSLFRFGDQQVSSAGDYSCFGAPLTVGNFNPFSGEPNGGNNVVTNAGPVTDNWAFGVGDPQYQFLQQNANVRDGAVGPPPQSLWNSMFATPVSDVLGAPPFPSQLRFMVDVYGSPPHTITRDELDECLVDGNLPPG
jgi:hypothetical protein